MRFACICLVLLLFQTASKAQPGSVDLTANFVFCVHSMDDFFDRFDFKRNTGFEKYVKKNYPDFVLNRKLLISHLFNLKNDYLKENKNISEFINQVTDSTMPSYIYYSDDNWYAELKCKVNYKKKTQNLKLILKVERSKQNTFKWSVVSAKADFLNTVKYSSGVSAKEGIVKKDSASGTKYFLSPASHGIDFVNLDRLFTNKTHVNDYIYQGQRSNELNKLIMLIRNSQVQFQQVNSISYHLFEINGWIIRVDYFNRNEKNSGWLINNLMKATTQEKNIFLKTQINVTE